MTRAFRDAGANRREAVRRVLALSFLEYAVLSVSALVASALLFFGLDGHASDGWTLPSLIVVPIFVMALWLPHRSAPSNSAVPDLAGCGGCSVIPLPARRPRVTL